MTSAGPVVFAVPGAVVAVGAATLAVVLVRAGARDASTRASVVLCAASGLVALLGWVFRPFVRDPATAFGLGVALLVLEILIHAVLLGLVVTLWRGSRGRWPGAVVAAWGGLVVLAAAVVAWPHAFIGRVGPLDGVPGLYRLDAGPGGLPWAFVMVAIRGYAVWTPLRVAQRDMDVTHAWRLRAFAASMGVSLVLFLLWLSNPAVIHLTGEAYLPGPIRFALPLGWTTLWLVGLALLATTR